MWTHKAENGDLDWRVAYLRAFNVQISSLLMYERIALDYYDPDLDYEDDLKAYNTALQDILYKELVQ